MILRRYPLALGVFALLLFFPGCDQNPLGTVDPRGNVPVVSQFLVTPSTIGLDTITYSGGLYQVKIVASTSVTDPDGADKVTSVTATVISPDGVTTWDFPLHDDGIAPDLVAGDGLYYGFITLSLAKSDVGLFHVLFSAVDRNQRSGTGALQSLFVSRHSTPPWLSNVVAPDTVIVPVGGGVSFRLAVTVGDSSGLADIQDVTLRVPEGNNPTGVLHLLDNGNVAIGNSVAGDGTYAIILQVNDSPTVRKRYSLLFQAIDRAGDTSATLTHYLVMR